MSKAIDAKPKLRPVEGYEGLFVYEGLKRNPEARREEIYYAVASAVRRISEKQGSSAVLAPSNAK